jgi:hypothetical protein
MRLVGANPPLQEIFYMATQRDRFSSSTGPRSSSKYHPSSSSHDPYDEALERATQTYTLFAADGRLYARNVRHKLIDLGSLARKNSRFSYELDGNQLVGKGFASEEDALHDIESRIPFDYLDGQFTALADIRESATPRLDEAVQLQITLDEQDER